MFKTFSLNMYIDITSPLVDAVFSRVLTMINQCSVTSDQCSVTPDQRSITPYQCSLGGIDPLGGITPVGGIDPLGGITPIRRASAPG
mmetsp:Transcript_4241/g.10432  ORF Transcript_4241/g.10432 Transcript_4241/m.10432 type:complete len:87 (+) Transcript_4241:391-651(+)